MVSRNSIPYTPGSTTIDDLEKAAILENMKVFHGDRLRVAKSLGISLRTLETRLKEYGETNKRQEAAAIEDKRQDALFIDRCRYGTKADPARVDESIAAKAANEEANDAERERDRKFIERCRNGSETAEQRAERQSAVFGHKPTTANAAPSGKQPAAAGVGVEPAKDAAEEHEVPVQERGEVQALLPEQAGKIRHRA